MRTDVNDFKYMSHRISTHARARAVSVSLSPAVSQTGVRASLSEHAQFNCFKPREFTRPLPLSPLPHPTASLSPPTHLPGLTTPRPLSFIRWRE